MTEPTPTTRAPAEPSTPAEPAPPAEAPASGDGAPSASGGWWSWLRVIGLALLAALLLRAFAFEAYRIPSSSMEGTLLVGDFLFVSKLHYGPRTPASLGLPFTDRYLADVRLPWMRLPGFDELERGDVVVFNFPPAPGPVDRKEHYVKRLVGLPGDTVQIVAKRVRVNGEALPAPPEARQLWRLRLAADTLAVEDVLRPSAAVRGRPTREEPVWLVEASAREAAEMARVPGVAEVAPLVRSREDGRASFPIGSPYTLDDYGPVVVPARGLTVRLDDATWPVYRDAIVRYEGVPAQRVAGGFEIAGALTDRHTFRQDYLFVLGDNRDDSADSRTWGFVPESHLVGKAVLIYFSWDAEGQAPRWARMLRGVE